MPDIFVTSKKKKEKKSAKKASKKKKKEVAKSVSEGLGLKYPKTHKERKALPGHSDNPLSAFNYFPDRVNFVNKDPEEQVILILRRHPITNIRWMIIAFFMFLAPSFLPLFSFYELLPARFQIIFVIMWYLISTAFVFEEFLRWYFHVNILTDERIIEVDFIHLVYREITDANIADIQDVTVEMGSPIRTIFNYGNILIQTAAELPKIDFEDIPQPDRVAKILRELRVEEEVEKLEGRVR